MRMTLGCVCLSTATTTCPRVDTSKQQVMIIRGVGSWYGMVGTCSGWCQDRHLV
jgi:hypothetical protein